MKGKTWSRGTNSRLTIKSFRLITVPGWKIIPGSRYAASVSCRFHYIELHNATGVMLDHSISDVLVSLHMPWKKIQKSKIQFLSP